MFEYYYFFRLVYAKYKLVNVGGASDRTNIL